MLHCRSQTKLPQAGLLRIKDVPSADLELLRSGSEVCHPVDLTWMHSRTAYTASG